MSQLTLDQKDASLFEEVISITRLREAFKAVRKNKGAAGIDGVNIKAFEQELDAELMRLAQEVRGWKYKPKPVRRVRIPKPDGGVRLLGIPCIRDRVLQYSLKMTLEPYFEKQFSESSYGFRPGRNQRQAIQAAHRYVVENGKEWVVDIDLEQFFDRINHDRVIEHLREKIEDKRILRLVGMTLRSGIFDNGELLPSKEGSVQGSPLSPLLSNIVLDKLDKELEKRGLAFCRYADDCNIFCGSRKAAERVMESICRFIEKQLKLKVNRQKSKVSPASQVKFLGFTILWAMIVVAKKSMSRAMKTVDELTPRRTHKTLEQQIDEINEWYAGWMNYYQMAECPSQFDLIESHIRRRLRAQFIRAQKRPRHLFDKFRARNVSRRLAAITAYAPCNVWRKSISRAAHQAWPVAWFRNHGLLVRSTDNLPHWYPLETKAMFL